jgi:hypothetical protein
MAEQFKNLASTTLNSAIDDSTTSISVVSAMGFTSGNFRILIDSEIMKVTGVSGATFTVVRHQEGTVATVHDNAAPVRHILTAGALDAHDQNDLAVRDAYANKPSAGVPGRLFLPTDAVYFERDNGSNWDKFGPLWPFTPPQVSDFPIWVNQGTATAVDNKGAIFINAPGVNSENTRAIVKAYPSPPFIVEMAFIPCAYPGSYPCCGLCIQDNVSGKLQTYGLYDLPMYVRGYNYSSPTTTNSGVTGWPGGSYVHQAESNLIWFKYEDDNTNRKISISVDGFSWVQMVSNSRTDYLTPTHIGIFVNPYQATVVCDTGCTFLHWKQY